VERDEGPERRRDDDLTRAERRSRRHEVERRRMPLHGKGLGLLVGNALRRRAEEAARPNTRRRG
jgi:hypothetical protein